MSLNHYDQYSQVPLGSDYTELVSIIISELYSLANFKCEASYYLIFSDTIESKIAEIGKKLHLKNNKCFTMDEFGNIFEDNLKKFLDEDKISHILPYIDHHMNQLSELNKFSENNFLESCNIVLNSLIENTYGRMLTMRRVNSEIVDVGKGNEQKITLSIKEPKPYFSKYFKEKNIKVNQIICLDKDVAFAFISSPEQCVTHVIRFNPQRNIKDDYKVSTDIQDDNVQVAHGSSPNKYIMFLNRTKKVNQGSLKENKHFERGTELDIYSKIKEVVSSYYMKKARKLLILDNDGKLFYKDLVQADSDLFIVKSSNLDSMHDRDNSLLNSSDGNIFFEIDVSIDENIIFLRTITFIECYDKNFIRTHEISVSGTHVSFKNVVYDNLCFLIIQQSKKIECYKIIVPKHETQIINPKKIPKVIEGNPIIDIHHMGLVKFGPLKETTQIIYGDRIIYYYSGSEKDDRILKYLKGLTDLKSNFNIGGYLSPQNLLNDLQSIKKQEFIMSVCVKFPLHVASIQNGNLIPLQNGLNNFEEFSSKTKNESFLDKLTDYIRFGNYEEIIENIEGALVLSILGRQSSGKSYLLNRLAGTRFDVAAERCTEGIWMGIGFINKSPVIVFDCEGLFTIERSTQEEIKLCLFISSLSDVIILNSDLSSGKHIKSLLDEFASGVDRLKGQNLFQGYLDITYRDIADNQEEGAQLEFEKFLQTLIDTGKKETLSKLFKEYIMNSLYHNFENKLFDEEVETIGQSYISELKKKWAGHKDLNLRMKMILAQIFSDDPVSMDIRMFSAQIRNIRNLLDKILENSEESHKYLPDNVFNEIIEIEVTKIDISLIIRDFYKDIKSPLKFFVKDLNIEKYDEIRRAHHNQWYTKLDEIIKSFFDARKVMITEYYKSKLPKSEDFKEQIAIEILTLENKLDKVARTFNLCPGKCNQCDFICCQFLYHTDIHDCGTDHICKQKCEICKNSSRCNLQNGHKFKHICKQLDHKCSENCKIGECQKTCTQNPGHEGTHKCSSSHPCGKLCKMNEKCGQFCKYDITDVHEEHNCEGKCPFKCIFDHDNTCSSKNHFHDDELSLVKDLPCTKISNAKKHLCLTMHSCMHEYESKGICSYKTTPSWKVYKNDYNQFNYLYVDLIPERNSCGSIIEVGHTDHGEGSHICPSKKHFCDARCPDCNGFCDLDYGHDGLHSSDTHRNKECSQYISTEHKFESNYNINKEKTTNTTDTTPTIPTTIIIVAGEPATPEFCDQYCITKGRGHSHPIPCQGGGQCLENTERGFAIHSNRKFKSASNDSILYDFVTCDTYWKRFGWSPPNEKTPEVQKIFGKCNYTCAHESHEETREKVYCEAGMFHSTSDKYSDHEFNCKHDDPTHHDIVFIIDCTGSMDSYFSLVKNVINNICRKWKNEENKFAVVGYTDHDPNNGNFPAGNPVSIYPSSRNLSDGKADQAANFIANMQTSGGGGNGGEALIDGLAEANKLVFRKDSAKIYILVGDEPAHGSEFSSSTAYPKGCPCGHKWIDLLRFMKTMLVKFLFVKLNEDLNKTIDKFQNYYGKNMIVMPLNGVDQFEIKVTDKVISTIENSYVYSSKLGIRT